MLDVTSGLKPVGANEFESFFRCLQDVIECAKRECDIIRAGGYSRWNLDQLNKIVLSEMDELFTHAREGKVFFKYGEQQRLLASSYLLTDSFEKLNVTALGLKIRELQKLYYSL